MTTEEAKMFMFQMVNQSRFCHGWLVASKCWGYGLNAHPWHAENAEVKENLVKFLKELSDAIQKSDE